MDATKFFLHILCHMWPGILSRWKITFARFVSLGRFVAVDPLSLSSHAQYLSEFIVQLSGSN